MMQPCPIDLRAVASVARRHDLLLFFSPLFELCVVDTGCFSAICGTRSQRCLPADLSTDSHSASCRAGQVNALGESPELHLLVI